MEKEILNCLEVLKKGGLILYPTDTIWGIGCDATNQEAVQKIYALKKRENSKALICMVSDTRMLEKYIDEVPEVAYDIIDNAEKPVSIIYDKAVLVAPNLLADDQSLAVRVVKDVFCEKLIQKFRRPIVSTSANISGDASPAHFKEISDEILKGVDYVVNLYRDKKNHLPSSVIKLSTNGVVKIIRK